MDAETQVLLITATGIAFLHTLAGPDHYLPFIVLSRTRGWSPARTVLWTLMCGCGHVWSSVLLALGGAAVGWSLSKLRFLESVRGGMAAWALLVFGLLYCIWGCFRLRGRNRHKHFDIEEDGTMYVYEHSHEGMVLPQRRHAVTPWVMFLIFVLGPCEPMIPLLYLPAVKSSWHTLVVLIAVYTICTLLAMLLMVMLGLRGIAFLQPQKLERFVHVLGGLAIFVCGVGMVFMGW